MGTTNAMSITRTILEHRHALLAAAALTLIVAGLPASAQTGPTLAHLPWMIGCWESADQEPGSGETWRVTHDGTMIGFSRSMRDARVVATEQMRIEKSADGNLVFIATPSGQETASFVLVNIADDEVVFENREHDYPQRIIYRLLALDRLLGRIEGVVDGVARSADFPFRRIPCQEESQP